MGRLDLTCIGELAALGEAGFAQGWHERNGGNASYRLRADEAQAVEAACPADAPWQPLGVQAPGLGG